MKRMMLIVGMTILLGFAATTVSMAQMGSQSYNPNAPVPNNQNKQHGLDRADTAAGDNGLKGRCNARTKQGLPLVPGCPGYTPPPPPPPPPPTDPCLGC